MARDSPVRSNRNLLKLCSNCLFQTPNNRPNSIQSNPNQSEVWPLWMLLCLCMHQIGRRSCLLLHIKDHSTCHCSSATVSLLDWVFFHCLAIYSTASYRNICSLKLLIPDASNDPRENPPSKLPLWKEPHHRHLTHPRQGKVLNPSTSIFI